MLQSSSATVSKPKPARGGQGFAPDKQRQRLKAAALVLGTTVSVLLSPGWLTAALSAPKLSDYPLPPSYDNKFINDIVGAQLTGPTFQSLVGDLTGITYFNASAQTGGINEYNGFELLAISTNDPLFYSNTTPRFYKYKFCNSDPTSYFIVGNVLVQSGDQRPEAKSAWYGRDSVQPTPDVTFDLCTQPKVPFVYPAGFVPAAVNGNYVFVRHSFEQKLSDTVPQNSQDPTFARNGLAVVVTRTNPSTPFAMSYTQQGTAVVGTDYSTSSNNGVVLTANTLTLPASNQIEYVPIGTQVPVFFNQNNHPQSTLQWVFTPPAAYTFLGQSTWNARILELNNSTVSVTPVNSQSTITPGSTAGGFVLTRLNGDQSKPLTVTYGVAGTAVNGTDYGYLSGTATIPAGQSTLNVPIIAQAPSGSTAVPQKDVQISLSPPTDFNYLTPASGAAAQSQSFVIPAYNPSTVSFTQGTGGGTLTPGQTQPFTVTRAGGDTTQPLTVNYITGGTAQPGVDYQPLSGSVTIPAGQTSATVPLSAIQKTGTTAAPATTLSLTPAAGTGYDATGATPISYDIPAYTPSTVSVSSPSNGGAIPAGGSVPFTVTRTGDTSQPLTIPYTIGGTATPGTDYSQLPGSITIPAGATSATQTITTPTKNGSTAEPSETIVLTPQSGTGYSVDLTGGTITYQTAAYTPSSVSATPGTGGSTIPQGTTGGFTISRTGDTSQPLPVSYTLGGTAQNGTDYNSLPGSVTIPAGQASVTVPVTVPAATGSAATPAKDIQVAVSPGNGYAPDATTPTTTLTIPAFAPSMVDFGTGNGGTLTPGSTSDGFTVTRSGDTTKPLTVGYTVGGTATPGVDYGQLPGTVTIPAGATSATVPLSAFPQSGTAAEGEEDVQITLQPGNGYAPSSTAPAVYTIPAYSPNANGNSAVTVSVPAGQDTILTPGTSTDGFTVTRTGDTSAPLPINYTVGGSGVSGTDYNPLSGTVTIPAGATSATVPLGIPAGATPGRTVAIAVTPGSGYDQGTNSTVTYTVEPQTAVAPTEGVIGIGFDSSIPAFVLTRDGGDLTRPLTVPVDFSGTGVSGVDYAQLPNAVTFGSGQKSATVPVRLLPTATTGKTLAATVPPGSGYMVGGGNGTTFTVPAGYNDKVAVATPKPVPATPAPTTSGKKGGNGGAVGFVAAAGAVGGSIALGSGAFGGAAAGAAGAAGSALAVPGLLASAAFGMMPQSCSTTGETPTELVRLIPQLKESQPNWSAITFRSLPAPSQAGSMKFGGNRRDWKAGQNVADIVRVSDTIGSFNLHCLGLSRLASMGQMGIATKPLSTLNLVSDTSIQGLSKTLYLRAKKIGDVKGMAEWLASKSSGKVTAEQLSGMSFADAIKSNPSLGGLQMGSMPLSELPGYNDILLGDIPNWKTSTVSQVSGLANVPFSQFPSQPKPLNALNK
ncbi:hypothetical protein H6F76_00490 [Leptolyngbya sp. FACHB-321]|uniref:beta strand repeat-containing protein n=1 Tax=Leptolyngbya sp. FACHB-321 TaxID=2692807 RepID=UPI001686D0D4|nr:Calx-beta domain-containing protein [Leptolyngbya sp. FACHB-321]MBD2033543.1 hypothetical protein [Leptolyngbya sp. FACHB-321]